MKKAACLLFLLVAGSVAYGGGKHTDFLLWEDQTGNGKSNWAADVVISGKNAIVSEMLQSSPSQLDTSVRGYDLRTGRVLWEDTIPAGDLGAEGLLAEAQGLVFSACRSSSQTLIRSYSANSGDILWTSIIPSSEPSVTVRVKAIAAADGHVTVVGYRALQSGSQEGLVRTYDAATGEMLWESDTPSASALWDVALDGRYVVIAGSTRPLQGPGDLFLQAYDAGTGHLLWESDRRATSPINVLIGHGQVFVAGIDFQTIEQGGTFLAAFDLNTGRMCWQSANIATSPDGMGRLVSLALNTSQLVAVGSLSLTGGFIQSVDPRTGETLWSDRTVPQTGFGESFSRVAIDGKAVYVVGASGQEFVFSETLLRVYSRDGQLLTDERSHRVISSILVSRFIAVSSQGKYLVAVGAAGNAGASANDALVRAYDVKDIQHDR